MKQIYGQSQNGNLKEAAASISNPEALILMTSAENFDRHVNELAEMYKGVPSIGGIGISYAGTSAAETGVTLIGLYGVSACAGAIEELSTMPVKYIKRLTDAINACGAGAGNSACFDFTTGCDGKLVTTLNVELDKRNIPLIGGTVDGPTISVNGNIYKDACAFLIIKNKTGKICAYKENIYLPTGQRFVATKTVPENMTLAEVDGHPAAKFYQEVLGISDEEVATQTFKNPFGRVYGNETYLISIKEINGNALNCYKQVNDMDILTLMELKDYKQIVKDTLDKMQKDLGQVSGIISVNCLFRYLLFQQEGYLNDYFREMNRFNSHAGLVGVGEHYCKQHINQTMCCIAFD